jgi:hypothetical protein
MNAVTPVVKPLPAAASAVQRFARRADMQLGRVLRRTAAEHGPLLMNRASVEFERS